MEIIMDNSLDYRHEYKHEIQYSDMLALKSRLGAVMSRDEHAGINGYHIRSLYFDNLYDKALNEKINGVSKREKFRIRYYNYDTSFIALEKKSKINNLCNKQIVQLSLEEVEAILQKDIDTLRLTEKPLLQEFYIKMKSEGLKPTTIVDYDRDPYTYAPGNVRVTLDSNIRTGISRTDFLNPACPMIPAGDAGIILEVKWDNYLPTVIRDIIQVPTTRTSAFSKYVACRIYG